jgi:hypothetical protein
LHFFKLLAEHWAPVGQMQHALANPCEVKVSWCELTDQSDNRELRIEILAPKAHLREDSWFPSTPPDWQYL